MPTLRQCKSTYSPHTALLNRSGFGGGHLFESRRHVWPLQHGVVAFLGFGRRDVSDGFQEPPVVEPIDPFQSSELDGPRR